MPPPFTKFSCPASWWLNNPFENYMIVKLGSSSPIFGMKMTNIWVATTYAERLCQRGSGRSYDASHWSWTVEMQPRRFRSVGPWVLHLREWVGG